MKIWRVIVLWLFCFTAAATEVIPPAPTQFFNDYANVTSAATAGRLNNTLQDFERQTSSQILVVVYPTLQTESSLEDYTVQVSRAWKAGQKGKDNGAILFVFVKEHRLRIEVGYGLEGALPDALCKRILDDEITPRFKQGDFDGGLNAGVNAMIAATKGEYKGTGRTANDGAQLSSSRSQVVFGIFIFFMIALAISRMFSRGGFGGSGWWIAANVLSGWNSGGSGRSGGGGGGGWSGGGGSFGGGGASGSW